LRKDQALCKNRIGKSTENDLSALRPNAEQEHSLQISEADPSALRPTLSKHRIDKITETDPSAFKQSAEQEQNRQNY